METYDVLRLDFVSKNLLRLFDERDCLGHDVTLRDARVRNCVSRKRNRLTPK